MFIATTPLSNKNCLHIIQKMRRYWLEVLMVTHLGWYQIYEPYFFFKFSDFNIYKVMFFPPFFVWYEFDNILKIVNVSKIIKLNLLILAFKKIQYTIFCVLLLFTSGYPWIKFQGQTTRSSKIVFLSPRNKEFQ